MKYHHKSTQMAKVKETDNTKSWQDVEKAELSQLVQMQNGTRPLKSVRHFLVK